MKLLHVTEDLVRSGGGLPAVIASHAAWQSRAGWDVSIVQTASSGLLDCNGATVWSCPPTKLGKPWRWSPSLSQCIQKIMGKGVDIVHLHGVWTAPQAIASSLAERNNVPCIISFHGQLLDAALGQGFAFNGLKKRLYLQLIGNKVVQRAKLLHAITEQEAETLRRLFPGKAVHMIPNFVDTRMTEEQIRGVESKVANSNKEILFLGRMDPRKGIFHLLHAFVQANLPEDWRLSFAGPDASGAVDELRKLITSYQMEKRIRVLGPVYGKNKWELLCNASLVCLPSFHEVIGMVNLEAALCSKVVLTTPFAGLEGWEEAGGILVEPSVENIRKALEEISTWSDEELKQRGKSLKAWVSEYYSLDKVRSLWQDLYRAART